MICFISFLILGILSSSCSHASTTPKIPKPEGEIGEFFWRPATKTIVDLLKNSMNQSVDPCDNFYEFACGNHGKTSNYSAKRAITEKIDKHVKDFLFNKLPEIVESKVVNATTAIMQSCLNWKRTKTMSEYFEEMMNHYRNVSLRDLFTILSKYDIPTSFGIYLHSKEDNSVILQVKGPSDGFNEEQLLLGTTKLIDRIILDEDLAQKVKDYNEQLIKIGNKPYDYASAYESIWVDINGIINAMGEDYLKSKKAVHTEYFERLDPLISKTDEEVVRAHALMKVTHYTAISTIDGVGKSLTDACFAAVFSEFQDVALTVVAKELLPKELYDGVKEVFDSVMESIEETLEKQEWLGLSRFDGIKRARQAVQWVGIPDKMQNYTELDTLKQAFEVDQHRDFAENWLEVLRAKQLEKVEVVNKSRYDLKLYLDRNALMDINAYNDVDWDLTIFTTAILQSPFFYYRFPDFYRYGLIGFVFGHEFGHGFAYDWAPGTYFGPYKSISKSAREEFKRRARCLEYQFNNDTLTTVDGFEHEMNGGLYLNENEADNIGFNVAFKAFKKALARTRHPKRLLELDEFTQEQLFFVSSAQFFCSSLTEAAWQMRKGDEHPPPPVRFNGVRNSDDFAKAFECPVGSKMNPQKKCRLWD